MVSIEYDVFHFGTLKRNKSTRDIKILNAMEGNVIEIDYRRQFINYIIAIYCLLNVNVVNIVSLLKAFPIYRLPYIAFYLSSPPSSGHPTFTIHPSVLLSDSSALSNGSKLVDWAVISCVHRLKGHRHLR